METLKDKVGKLEAAAVFDSRAETVIAGFPRSCDELKEISSNYSPGEYIIDPDGMHIGNDPITVICDETGNLYKTWKQTN